MQSLVKAIGVHLWHKASGQMNNVIQYLAVHISVGLDLLLKWTTNLPNTVPSFLRKKIPLMSVNEKKRLIA